MRGLVFDREDVVDAILPQDRMQERISVQAGGFFDALPSGADIYMLIFVLHNWDDEACLRILRNCRGAMSRIVADWRSDPGARSGARAMTTYLIDMQMMAMFGCARERTEAEFPACSNNPDSRCAVSFPLRHQPRSSRLLGGIGVAGLSTSKTRDGLLHGISGENETNGSLSVACGRARRRRFAFEPRPLA